MCQTKFEILSKNIISNLKETTLFCAIISSMSGQIREMQDFGQRQICELMFKRFREESPGDQLKPLIVQNYVVQLNNQTLVAEATLTSRWVHGPRPANPSKPGEYPPTSGYGSLNDIIAFQNAAQDREETVAQFHTRAYHAYCRAFPFKKELYDEDLDLILQFICGLKDPGNRQLCYYVHAMQKLPYRQLLLIARNYELSTALEPNLPENRPPEEPQPDLLSDMPVPDSSK